ncbi:MAG: DUF2306 domain-containing protein [Gemmataceae bacterium]
MARPALERLLRWAALVLIARVLAVILWNYLNYFPPRFDSDFLLGRESIFHGAYRIAFYAHIVSGPLALVNGLALTSLAIRQRWPKWHRRLGMTQLLILLPMLLASGVLMACHAFAGWWAGSAFLALAGITGGCAVAGFVHARSQDFHRHRRWMLRCQVLVCSAVVLRLISGAAGLAGVEDAEAAYVLAAWASWLMPMALLEAYFLRRDSKPASRWIAPAKP